MANCNNTSDFLRERNRYCASKEDCFNCIFAESECEAAFGEINNLDYDYSEVINKLQKWSDNHPEEQSEDKPCDNSDSTNNAKDKNEHEYSFKIDVYDMSEDEDEPVAQIGSKKLGRDKVLDAVNATLEQVVFKMLPIKKENMYIEMLLYCDGNCIEEFNNEDDTYEEMIGILKHHLEVGTTKIGEDSEDNEDNKYAKMTDEEVIACIKDTYESISGITEQINTKLCPIALENIEKKDFATLAEVSEQIAYICNVICRATINISSMPPHFLEHSDSKEQEEAEDNKTE